MAGNEQDLRALIDDLNERAKELNCLYKVEELLKDYGKPLREVFETLIQIIPPAWKYTNFCMVKIIHEGNEYASGDFTESNWLQSSLIIIDKKEVGEIRVSYSKLPRTDSTDPFLSEEKRLLDTIAQRLATYLSHRSMEQAVIEWEKAKDKLATTGKSDWKVIIDLLKRTDTDLYLRLSRKMMNFMCWIGVDEAKTLLQSFGSGNAENNKALDENKPMVKKNLQSILELSDLTFSVASNYITDEEILQSLQKWLQEDKLNFLMLTLESLATSLADIQNAITRFHNLDLGKMELSEFARKNINVMSIYRFFTDQLEFINIAKNFVNIEDFYQLVQHMIFPNNSHGKLGGKSAGIFLAGNILRESKVVQSWGDYVKVPKAWYITSDTMHYFLYYNNLKEVIEQKYKTIEQVREEYPNIIQIFKNSYFPTEIIKGLSLALDDFGEKPIIVRSSSLLEDRVGAAFAGKYKSLFLANQGTKSERLNAMMDAIAEVYASTFSPDPIEYRTEKGLLDFHEEMAIVIQEVVGTKVGHYYLPAFAGVGFSNNEFRWSPRIRTDDGLLRIVPGLGTRAVDRLSDDYPILAAPGQPTLRVNVTPDEQIRYSPKRIDVINLNTNTFETITIKELLAKFGDEFPIVDSIVSVYQGNRIMQKNRFNLDFENDYTLVNFEGLMSKTPFLERMKIIMNTLKDKIGIPVDIEFASDGKHLFILQCRAQSHGEGIIASSIPKDIPEKDIIFTARKYISNGTVPHISHIVYVDPDKYNSLPDLESMILVGRAVGSLNKLLPKRKFVLMGPGRWGSRGDIKLGVNVTYSDINNTAMLIEIARRKGNYVPDLSFGTHFFQDLVESSIRYIPLYPDDENIVFNEAFLTKAENIFCQLLPQYAQIEEVVRVIDVEKESNGKRLRILMNADLEEALAYLSSETEVYSSQKEKEHIPAQSQENHWRWRMRMAEQLAAQLDEDEFGVKGIYIFGSTKNANAGPGSDIDLLIHTSGDSAKTTRLSDWLSGWSLCLSEMNYLRTGYKTNGLLDSHFVTDDDIRDKNSFAVKINAITDAARALKTKNIK